MEKMITVSKKLDVFFGVIQKLIVIGLSVAFIVTAVLTVVNIVDPDAVIGEGFNTVDVGNITVELDESLAHDNKTILSYVWMILVPGAVSGAFIYYAVILIRKILAPMKEGRPFDLSVGTNIKKIGYISLVLGVIKILGDMIETAVTLKVYELTELTDGAVRSITANYTFDLSFLIVFFVLMLVAYIFNYGAELQELSDETL